MARRVFFSFHHGRDAWRVGQVRNCWMTQQDRQTAGFWDAAEWEAVKRKTDIEIRRWIDAQMHSTSVTVVLIGAETANRDYVRYEIQQSLARGNGLLGVRIHNVKGSDGSTDLPGANPLPNGYATYDWVQNDGRANFASWVEATARQAGR